MENIHECKLFTSILFYLSTRMLKIINKRGKKELCWQINSDQIYSCEYYALVLVRCSSGHGGNIAEVWTGAENIGYESG